MPGPAIQQRTAPAHPDLEGSEAQLSAAPTRHGIPEPAPPKPALPLELLTLVTPQPLSCLLPQDRHATDASLGIVGKHEPARICLCIARASW